MASFHAELKISGSTYPVRSCAYEFTQATNERGRVMAKVRHGLVYVTLDVPGEALLLGWGTTAHKLLAGPFTFFARSHNGCPNAARRVSCSSYFALAVPMANAQALPPGRPLRPPPKPPIISAPASRDD